jgi:protein-S-isoprenylcysteine O-methyltransferase Ste14
MQEYGYGQWFLVIFNIVLFGLFALSIPFKKKSGRRSGSTYLAFITALFTEMYGFPLTIFILAWLFNYQNPLTHESGHIWAGIIGEQVFFTIFHPLSNLMMLFGAILVIIGWRRIHNAKDQMVTGGIYSYIRHPQYLGFLLITSGMLVQWITIPTALMWPILITLYYRLAKEEEKEMEERFGEAYLEYKDHVPMFIPFLTRNKKKSGLMQ